MEKVENKIEQGWGDPDPFRSSSKYHFFGKDGRSLCGKYGRLLGLPEVFDENDESADNCAACKKKIAKYRSQVGGENGQRT